MNKKTAFGIIIIILISAAAGYSICFRSLVRSQPKANVNSDFTEYLNKNSGVSFEYPKWWGEVDLNGATNYPDYNFSFARNSNIQVNINSEQSQFMDLECPTKENYTSTSYGGMGSTNGDFIYCKKTQSDNGLIMQIFTGNPSFGINIETIVFSPDKTRYVIVNLGPEAALQSCNDCGIPFKGFADNADEKNILETADACVQGEGKLQTCKTILANPKILSEESETAQKSDLDFCKIQGPINEASSVVSSCRLSADETRLLYELDNFAGSIKVKNQ